jgi:hypothetical protein
MRTAIASKTTKPIANKSPLRNFSLSACSTAIPSFSEFLL